MIEIKEKNKCSGCYACYNICPKNAIEMQDDEKGFKYPVINNEKCINCDLCEKVCPIINKTIIKNNPKVYAAYSKNDEIRLQSSSGGIFSLIAEYILKNNGVIYGAAFNNEFQVEHIRIENINELDRLRTSKYVQSSIKETYKKTREDLDNDKVVLFTGTPCQINGLKSFLNKEYENLYTQDIICHGVPSPKVWKKYLEYRKKMDSKSPMRINFRQKDDGWNLYALLLQYNNNAYKTNHNDDLFMQAFLRDAILRDSCYACNFKDKNRISDITLADFWGVDEVISGFNDNKGTSLVIVNSENGKKLFEKIKNEIVFEETNFEESIKYNTSMYKSVKLPNKREEFFKNLDKMEFDELVKLYTVVDNSSLIRRIVRKCKRIIKRI